MGKLGHTIPLGNILNFSRLLQNKPFLTGGVSVPYRTGAMGARDAAPPAKLNLFLSKTPPKITLSTMSDCKRGFWLPSNLMGEWGGSD